MKIKEHVPNIQLVDDSGHSGTFHQLIEGKTVVLNMFYSHCQIKCQPLGRLMRRVNLLLSRHIIKDKISFISITLDAENDGIPEINEFKQKVWTNKCLNWKFYTGNYNEIEHLRRKLGMYSPEPEIDAIKSNHSGHFLIFNQSLGFIKHSESFDNPIEIARKVLQIVPRNFYCHTYSLTDLDFDAMSDDELFENIHSINSVFTVPFLPKHIRDQYEKQAENQRGFQYDPLDQKINKDKPIKCCCKSKSKSIQN